MNESNSLTASIFMLISMLIIHACTQGLNLGGGQTFKILENPDGIGTLLIFYKPYETESDKLGFDVNLLSEIYGEKLRIVFIDFDKKQELVYRHQVQEVPTLVLFNRIGTESYRWLPSDFNETFGKREMQRVIDHILIE